MAEREGLPPKQIEPAALERLKRYRWPGNVRELENLARRLAALYPQETITAAVIDAELAQPAIAGRRRRAAPGRDAGRRGRAASRRAISASFGDGLPPPGLYHRILREVEYPLLSAALAATRGNQIRAADLLGRQPQHAAQEDPRPRHPGDPHQQLSALRELGRRSSRRSCVARLELSHIVGNALHCAIRISCAGESPRM